MSDGRDVWGPVMWASLHNIAYGAPKVPDASTPDYRSHLKAVMAILPCKECSKHALEHFARYPPADNSRATLTKWVHDFHNRVNKRLGKPHHDDYHEGFIGMSASNGAYWATGVVLALVFGVIGGWYLCKNTSMRQTATRRVLV